MGQVSLTLSNLLCSNLIYYLLLKPICLKYAIASADPNRNSHGHQQHVVQPLLFGQVCGVHALTPGRELRSQSLHVALVDVLHLPHNNRCISHFRTWTVVLDPSFMHSWTLPDRYQRLINDLLTDSDVLILHSLTATYCLWHDTLDGKIGPYVK